MRETMVEGPDPLLGSTVAGRYTVMRRIARGGMGVVYLAVQEGLGRAVALKIIRKEAAGDPVMQKRFEREARAVSQLAHPAIVTVHDFGRTDDGSLFLAMEFVDGEPLRDALRRKKRFSFAETLPIVENIASALARAHAAGVVHRDLKPENVMLPRQSQTTTGAVHAKVLDFGLAKPHDPSLVDEHLTKAGGFVGTPGYASPEQAEGAPESPQQDLYALGVLWFELLTGEHPFAAPTPMKMVVRQLNEEPPSLDARGRDPPADAPAAAIALVRKLMARRAEDRPESAHVVLEELARLRSASLAPTPPARAPSPYDSTPEAATLDGRAPLASPAAIASATTATPPVAAAPAAAPVPSRSSSSSIARLALAIVVAAGLGVAVVVALTHEQRPAPAAADGGVALDDEQPPRDERVVRPTPLRGVEVTVDGLPSFKALQSVRAALGDTQLRGFAAGRASFVVLDAETAGPLADRLQGVALHSDLPLVLEVVEVREASPPRVTLKTVRPEDASALADAGALLDGGSIADAGDVDVVTPGGLTP